MNGEEERKSEEDKKRQKALRRSLTQSGFAILLLAVGGFVALALVGMPSKDFEKSCHEIDANLSTCISRFNLQIDNMNKLQVKYNELANQTLYMTNKNAEFGGYICQEYGQTYFADMSTPSDKIICYDYMGNKTLYNLSIIAPIPAPGAKLNG